MLDFSIHSSPFSYLLSQLGLASIGSTTVRPESSLGSISSSIASDVKARIAVLSGGIQIEATEKKSTQKRVAGKDDDSDFWFRFLAGGVAGATAKTIIAPLDRVKIIFQISNKPYSLKGVFEELKYTYKNGGISALFRGNSAQILRVYPYSGIQLASFDLFTHAMLYEKSRRLQLSHGPNDVADMQLDPVDRMLAGAMAGATSVTLTYPLDLLRARLAVQREASGGKTHNLWDAMKDMYRHREIHSIYRGLAPTLLGILPYASISFATYGSLKDWSRRTLGGKDPSNFERLLYGGVAGLVGQMSCYPLDIVRRRMQTEGFSPIHINYQNGKKSGMIDMLKSIYSKEGKKALFKGVSMNVFKGPIAVGVSFTTYDLLKKMFHIPEYGR